MAVKFSFEEPNGAVTTVTCSALSRDNAHRILSGAHFSDTGTFMLNHDDGTDIFTLSKYKRVNFREVSSNE